MMDISVKGQLRKLVELQNIDGEIYNLKSELNNKPLQFEDLKSEFERSKEKLRLLEEKAKAVQLARKEQELELKCKEDQIAKANVQLAQVKTNKEYTAKLSEIESLKADNALVEEKILRSYDESDALQAKVKEELIVVKEKENVYLEKKRGIEEEMKLLEDRVKVLEAQRKQISPDIERHALDRYERILHHKEGLAIVPVKGNSCGGCYMNVPSQKVNTIKMHDSLIECEMCLRILYLEDDL